MASDTAFVWSPPLTCPEMDDLPNNRLMFVVPCLGLVLFLAALDQTIIATALPIIAGKFNATPSEYSWVITVGVRSRREHGLTTRHTSSR